MSGGAGEQVSRLLVLAPYLLARESVSVDQAAIDLGVTPKQIRADLSILFMCGLPGGMPDDLIDIDFDALEGEGTIRLSNADYLSRPLRLSSIEATSLLVALRTMRDAATAEVRPAIDSVLSKLEGTIASAPQPDQMVVANDPEELAVTRTRSALMGAISAGRQVEMDYYVPTRDAVSTRVIDPHDITDVQGAAYLLAWCHTAEAPRTFRLDRVHNVRQLDQAIITEPVPTDLSSGAFQADTEATKVVLDLSPRVGWFVDYYPLLDQRPTDDGHVEVTMAIADLRWLDRLVLRLAPHVRVVSPADVVARVDDAARAVLDLYSNDA